MATREILSLSNGYDRLDRSGKLDRSREAARGVYGCLASSSNSSTASSTLGRSSSTGSSGGSAVTVVHPSPEVLKASDCLSRLSRTSNADLLSNVCLQLSELIVQADSECLQFLLESDAVGVVVKTMRSLSRNSTLQQEACEVLLCCNEHPQLRALLDDHRAFTAVLAAIKDHHADPYLIGKALQTLASLAATTVDDSVLREGGAYAVVMAALKDHEYDITIQCGGLTALAHLLQADSFGVSNILEQRDYLFLLQTMSTHKMVAAVVSGACRVLTSLVACARGREKLLEEDHNTLELAMEAIERYPTNEGVVGAAGGLINALVGAGSSQEHVESFIARVNRLKLLDCLSSCLQQHYDSLEIQTNIFSALGYLCPLPGLDLPSDEPSLDRWLSLLNTAFRTFRGEACMQEAGCRCLARLLEVKPELLCYIGDNKAMYQIPLHNSVSITLITLLNLEEDQKPAIFQAVSLAVYYLVVDNVPMQSLLLERGIAEVMLEGLRQFLVAPLVNETCVEFGCRALIGLLMSQRQDPPTVLEAHCEQVSPLDHVHATSPAYCSALNVIPSAGGRGEFPPPKEVIRSQKDHLVGSDVDILSDLSRILDDFAYSCNVLVEATGVIACLGDAACFRKVVSSLTIHCQILSCMKEHHASPLLVESALELLITMCWENEEMTRRVIDTNVIETITSALKHHLMSPSIQRKGFLLLQLVLVGDECLSSQSLCDSLSKVISTALLRWQSEMDVLLEVLVCCGRLCVLSALMSETLVKEDIHLLLFNLLYLEEEGEEGEVERSEMKEAIFQHGVEVIYTLSCVRDLKQTMLTGAVRDGMLEGMAVLVDVGADVTKGEGPDTPTPICLAVLSGHKDMVDHLLQKGVTDVRRAFALAREKKMDDIIGLLLKQISLDQSGGALNLSGMDLSTINPLWLLPSLGLKRCQLSRGPGRNHRRSKSLDAAKEYLKNRRNSMSCPRELVNRFSTSDDFAHLSIRSVHMTSRPLYARQGADTGTGSSWTSSGVTEFSVSRNSSDLSVSGATPYRATPKRRLFSQTKSSGDLPVQATSSSFDMSCRRGNDRTMITPDLLRERLNAAAAVVEENDSAPHGNQTRKISAVGPNPLEEFLPSLSPILATPESSARRPIIPDAGCNAAAVEETDSAPYGNRMRRLSPAGLNPLGEFIPSLPPIQATPESTLRRPVNPDAGFKMADLLGSISPNFLRRPSNGSVGSGDLTHSLILAPRRRHQEKKDMITGVTRLPFTRYRRSSHGDVPNGYDAPPNSPLPTLQEEVPSNPAQLVWHLFSRRKRRRKKKRRSIALSLSSEQSSLEGSPISPFHLNTTMILDYSSSDSFSLSASQSTLGHRPTLTPSSLGTVNGSTADVPFTFSKSFGIVPPVDESAEQNSLDASDARTSTFSSACNTPLSWSRRSSVVEETDFEPIVEEPAVDQNLIRVFDVSSNLLKSLSELAAGGPVFLSRLKDLVRLDLRQNQITTLPRELMEELTSLAVVNLSYNHFEFFPMAAVLSADTIGDLDFTVNQIAIIPPLPVLRHLVKLNLSCNCLTEFPFSLNGDTMPSLRKLNLKNNQIAFIEDADTRLSELEVLDVSNNRIPTLPEHFLCGLRSLRTLNASRNEIVLIPGQCGKYLAQLHTLKVAHNSLSKEGAHFNIFISCLSILQVLDASENGLHSLPAPYSWESRGLRDLRMTGNKVSRLDLADCDKFWPHLECFYIGQNRIKEIPSDIGGLRSLSILDISHNKDIRHLPDEMGALEHLFLLNLAGLKNLSLHPSLVNAPTKSIINYLKSRHQKSLPYYHMKLMVVGAAEKGKTTLLRQLIKSPAHKGPNVATLGVIVKQWTYQQRPGVTYHINCWDFAGQVEFYSTHQCFLTCRSLYVVAYNLSFGESELASLLPWLLNIQARAPSSPILIVGTHVDKVSPDELEERRHLMRSRVREMLMKPGFPTEVSFSEINCFDELSMGQLRNKIKDLIDSAKLRGQKIMGGKVPADYLILEEVILRERRRMEKSRSMERSFPVLQVGRLRDLMEENKPSLRMDKPEFDQAIQFLHECGVLLHYSDVQSNLSDLFFLDPEWLCDLMARVITVPQLRFISVEGLLQVKNIPHLLKEPRFPAQFQREYIRLLEKFLVALSQTPSTLLIPSCLPKAKPSNVSLPPAAPGSQLIRRYVACYIPPGFWPRMIARLITFPRRALPSADNYAPNYISVWSGGVYIFWSEQAFFLLELLKDKVNTFDITVPTTQLGTKLLCAVVDNVEALIDEWFPGLRDIDIRSGAELLVPMSLCPLCPIPLEPHCFTLSELQKVSLSSDEVHCPQHHGTVPLEQLAPDIIISDLDLKFKLSPDEFQLNESSSNILGKGGFGEVYKAMFRNQAVAVKVYLSKVAEINNTTPNHLIRQEVSILSQLNHPNIISMVGVCLRPKSMLLLEYAELGSLSTLSPYVNVSLSLKHRISLQVASALAYLHKRNVIYRDLKPDNVLLFSLSLLAKVNAKLSDYGISCFATEAGLMQPIGTPGSKAPELLMAGATYNEKVDIYSYGLLLFILMTNGHRPFEELSAGFEIDKAIEQGRPINDIEHYGCPPWPDMQDLITHCLQFSPGNRPSGQEIFDRLCSAEFVSLKRAVQVQYDHNIETFAIRFFTDKRRGKNVEVWMASTVGTQSQLSILNLSRKTGNHQGHMMPPGVVIFSVVAVGSSFVLLGSQAGVVHVYDGFEQKEKHRLAPLRDSILCLLYFKSQSEGVYYVCAGLANGELAFYDQHLLTNSNAQAQVMEVGSGPIRSMKRHHAQLFVGSGAEVVVVKISSLSVVMRWKAVEDPHSHLNFLDVGSHFVWTAQSRSPQIRLWDIQSGIHRTELQCDVIMNSVNSSCPPLDPRSARVTAMFLQPPPDPVLWVGLASGHVILINAATRSVAMVVQRHVSSVREIQSVKATVNDKPIHLILTSGFGFLQRPGYEVMGNSKGTPESHGNLLVWDSILPRIKAHYDDIKEGQEPYR